MSISYCLYTSASLRFFLSVVLWSRCALCAENLFDRVFCFLLRDPFISASVIIYSVSGSALHSDYLLFANKYLYMSALSFEEQRSLSPEIVELIRQHGAAQA